MATYYVDAANGSDAQAGTSWALAKATLDGAEDIPVAAGDTVRYRGVFRELLTCDVSGTVGNPITYIADELGEDAAVCGQVARITGSDDDEAIARAHLIDLNYKEYRTFRGGRLDLCSDDALDHYGKSNIFEDLRFEHCARVIYRWEPPTGLIMRRCMAIGGSNHLIQLQAATTLDDRAILFENCIFIGPYPYSVILSDMGCGGVTVRNCWLHGSWVAVLIGAALAGGQTVDVENCILTGNMTALEGTVGGEIVEDFNDFSENSTDRTNVAVGGDSVTHPPMHALPILYAGAGQVSGYVLPWWFGNLSRWSALRAITGSNEPSVDLRGIARPVTAAKNSWGPLQFQGLERDTTTVWGNSVASQKLADARRVQMLVAVDDVATTIKVQVQREANYAGVNPQMVIKQPGQANRTTVDTGAVSVWNELSDTFTPDAGTDFVIVELVSNNTAAAGSYAVYFDNLAVSSG